MAGTALSVLRTELRARLGLSAVADTSGPSQAILNSILARAQTWLYWAYNWEYLRRTWTITPLVIGTAAYAYPANGAGESPEPRKILDVSRDDSTGNVDTLRQGVSPSMKNSVTANGLPTRYWRTNLLNLWPAPDKTTYKVYIDGFMALKVFAADADTSTIDDGPLLDLAIALGKFHYGQADAQTYLQLVNTLIGKLNDSDETSGYVEPLKEPNQAGAP